MSYRRIGVFIDTTNLYHCCLKRFNTKIDYNKLLNAVEDFGNIAYKIAYGFQTNGEAKGFIACLKALGCQTKFMPPKDGNHRVSPTIPMVIDIAKMEHQIDLVVICSSNKAIIPILDHLKEQCIPCVVMGCGVSSSIARRVENVFELDVDGFAVKGVGSIRVFDTTDDIEYIEIPDD